MDMKAVNIFKALSDETRLRLVHLSLHCELNVNEIVAVMGMGQSRISRHLKILTDNQLLTYRRDGLWTFYSGVTEGEGHRFIKCISYLFDRDSIYAADLRKAREVLEERSAEAVRFFDSIAEDWEKLKREIIGDVQLNGMILDTVPQSDIVVDLGCGTGDLLEYLKEKAKQVIGVEKSPKMLDGARRRFAGDGKNIDLRIGELEHLPLREGEADMAIVNMVLHHLPDPQIAIREVYRVLKLGSSFVIVDLLNHEQEKMRVRYGDRWLGFSIEDIRQWLENSGFVVGVVERFQLKKGLQGFMIRATRK
jgi:ubiquinone/menaquinone biosynthesis C-methylase UbiE